MKTILKLSVLLNLLLAGGMVFFAMRRGKEVPLPAPREITVPVAVVPNPVSSQPDIQPSQPQPFRWRQLDSGSDYRLFIANLRAAGCPENTIEDIVRGNVARAFAWERTRQRMDSSGNGPWSNASETALVNSLLGKPSTASMAVSTQDANGQSAGQQALQTPVHAGYPTSQSGQSGQSENTWMAENAGPQQNLPLNPWPSQRGNSGPSSSASSPQLAIPSQQPGNSSGATQIPISADPQNSVPAPGNPIDAGGGQAINGQNNPASPDSPAGPPGPPDPLGPNDPYAKSAEDINLQGIAAYNDWVYQHASQAGDGTMGINPLSGPR